MSISSSLNAGVMGLNVNATKLATISDNIANSATYGYKRSDVDFSSMVINQGDSVYAAGGVRAKSYKDIDVTGSLVSTGNALDIAINGNGMIPVTDEFGVNDAGERDFMMVPTGSFSADQDGFLRTRSGLHLLGWPADVFGDIGTVSRESTSGLVPVNINVSQYVASPTSRINLGMNIPAEATLPTASGDPFVLPVEYYDTLGLAQTAEFTMTPNLDPLVASNSWTVNVTDTAAGAPTAIIASFNVTFSDLPGEGGSIASVTPGTGTTYDAATGEIGFNVQDGPITAFIGRPGESDGMTQLAAPFSPYNVSKDGAPIGSLDNVEINAQGDVQAVYASGFRRTLYRVPVADVPNINGLRSRNNQAFSVSPGSGDVYLWDAGTGPAGGYAGYSLMESNTDIAAELTSLIETQRAYSSNAKIIQTVDEMLQETTNLKR